MPAWSLGTRAGSRSEADGATAPVWRETGAGGTTARRVASRSLLSLRCWLAIWAADPTVGGPGLWTTRADPRDRPHDALRDGAAAGFCCPAASGPARRRRAQGHRRAARRCAERHRVGARAVCGRSARAGPSAGSAGCLGSGTAVLAWKCHPWLVTCNWRTLRSSARSASR